MIGFWSVVIGVGVLLLMVVPLLLISIGAVEIFKITKRYGALLPLFGGILIGITGLDFLANIILMRLFSGQDLASLLLIKGYVVIALNYMGYLLIALGVYLHAQTLKEAVKKRNI